jgi:hypothetical protein
MAKLTVLIVAERLGLHQSSIRRRMRKYDLTLREVLKQGGTKRPRMRPGERYSHLTVTEVLPSLNGGNARVIARCDCGRLKEAHAMNLKSRRVTACGECGLGERNTVTLEHQRISHGGQCSGDATIRAKKIIAITVDVA